MHVMEGEGTCCRMWITNMERMEKRNVMPKEVQRNTVARMKKRTQIIKEANKTHYPPSQKNQLNKSKRIKIKIKAFICILKFCVKLL